MLLEHEEGAAPATDGPSGKTQLRIDYTPDLGFSAFGFGTAMIALAVQMTVDVLAVIAR